MNQTQTVRNAINFFIIVSVGVSLFQEVRNLSHKPMAPQIPSQESQPIPTQLTGPKLQGIRFQSSDNFQAPLKQMLARKQLNVEIAQYEFQGNEYWMNMLANWGHIGIIFYFMTKHKNETDAGKKTQILIMGAIAVVGWFYFSPKLKPQKFAIEVKGRKVFEKDYFIEQQVANALDEFEFEIQDMNESIQANPTNEKVDAWAERKQPSAQQQKSTASEEQVIDDTIEDF